MYYNLHLNYELLRLRKSFTRPILTYLSYAMLSLLTTVTQIKFIIPDFLLQNEKNLMFNDIVAPSSIYKKIEFINYEADV